MLRRKCGTLQRGPVTRPGSGAPQWDPATALRSGIRQRHSAVESGNGTFRSETQPRGPATDLRSAPLPQNVPEEDN